jgi:hypothetical protein
MQDFISLIREFGFPVFVACFLLLKMQPTLHSLDKSIARLIEHLSRLGM